MSLPTATDSRYLAPRAVRSPARTLPTWATLNASINHRSALIGPQTPKAQPRRDWAGWTFIKMVEPTRLNANHFARLSGGRISLNGAK